jgi:2-(1,2-epoxy-1,2-dihydrophenyl)acetyl-CoA isomerase
MSLAADTGGTAVEDTVLVDVGDGVAWVRLNRPDRLNALTYPMMDRIHDALAALAEDEAVRAVVLTGTGRAFCAGADTRGMAERRGMDPDARRTRIEQSARASLLLHGMGKPTVAAINGAAVGAGLGMALACDLKLMAAGAKLVPGFARVGLSGDFGVSWFTTRQIGAARALRLLMLDEHLDAKNALELGLVDEVVEDERLEEAAADLAGRLASGPTRAYSRMKANVALAAVGDLESVVAQESRHMVDCMATADYAEAIAAFADKRSPDFTGR